MKITEVKVFPVSEEKLKAFVSIVLDGCFMVNDIKVICGKDGLFISMPSRKKKNGEFKDVAHPLNNETRQMIESFVLDEYERILRERGEVPEAERRQLPVESSEPSRTPRRPEPDAVSDAPTEAGSPPPPVAEERFPAAEARPRGVEPGGLEEPPAREDEPGEGAEKVASGEPGGVEEEESKEDKSLEEIQELHLRDSFWSVS